MCRGVLCFPIVTRVPYGYKHLSAYDYSLQVCVVYRCDHVRWFTPFEFQSLDQFKFIKNCFKIFGGLLHFRSLTFMPFKSIWKKMSHLYTTLFSHPTRGIMLGQFVNLSEWYPFLSQMMRIGSPMWVSRMEAEDYGRTTNIYIWSTRCPLLILRKMCSNTSIYSPSN